MRAANKQVALVRGKNKTMRRDVARLLRRSQTRRGRPALAVGSRARNRRGGRRAAAAGGVTCKVGLIQQEFTRPLRLSAAFGSILLECSSRQRKVAWIWPLGQPNRSYRSRWRKAVSRSSRHNRLTTRRPSQTHSGLPAGPAQRLLRFGKFVDFLRLLGRLLAVRWGLIGRLGLGVLGQRRSRQRCRRGRGEPDRNA